MAILPADRAFTARPGDQIERVEYVERWDGLAWVRTPGRTWLETVPGPAAPKLGQGSAPMEMLAPFIMGRAR